MIVLVSMLLVASAAAADVLPSRPRDCPPGAVGASARGGAWCRPTGCGGMTGCPPGTACSAGPVGLCVRERTLRSSRRTPDGVQTSERDIIEALGACADDGACDVGTCERVHRCVPSAPEATSDRVEEPAPLVPTTATPSAPAASPAAPLEEEPAPGPSTPGACGCRVIGAPSGGLAALGLTALLVGGGLVSRRRRSAPESR